MIESCWHQVGSLIHPGTASRQPSSHLTIFLTEINLHGDQAAAAQSLYEFTSMSTQRVMVHLFSQVVFNWATSASVERPDKTACSSLLSFGGMSQCLRQSKLLRRAAQFTKQRRLEQFNKVCHDWNLTQTASRNKYQYGVHQTQTRPVISLAHIDSDFFLRQVFWLELIRLTQVIYVLFPALGYKSRFQSQVASRWQGWSINTVMDHTGASTKALWFLSTGKGLKCSRYSSAGICIKLRNKMSNVSHTETDTLKKCLVWHHLLIPQFFFCLIIHCLTFTARSPPPRAPDSDSHILRILPCSSFAVDTGGREINHDEDEERDEGTGNGTD